MKTKRQLEEKRITQQEVTDSDKTIRLPRPNIKYRPAQPTSELESERYSSIATLPVPTMETTTAQQEEKADTATLYRNPQFFVRTADSLKRQRKAPHLAQNDPYQTKVLPAVSRSGGKKPHADSPHTNTRPTVGRSGGKTFPHILSQSMTEQIQWLVDEKQHVIETDTRQLPALNTLKLTQVKTVPLPAWRETLLVVVALVASFFAHAFNMFNFPHYEQDEGTYVSSAWAILHGMLQVYPYRYDHPPVGWIQIAAWTQLTGGFFTFGNALNSGRVLMLLYALGCSALVYLISRRLSGSRAIAFLATIILSLSPLAITYQRQVFLDNIATFWFLLSLYLLIVGKSRLFYVVSAAVSFGLAILSKEVLLLFMPAMLYAAWLYTTPFQRRFSLIAFTYIIVSLGSGFLLLAVLKGELFPTGWLPWDHHQHLSLLGTLVSQVQRTQSQGDLRTSFNAWTQNDRLLVIVSSVAIVINLIGGWWNRRQWLIALLALSYYLLFVRGGVVFPYYIIPLLPLMALNIALALDSLLRLPKSLFKFNLTRVLLVCGIIAAILPYDVLYATPAFTQHPTSTQTAALSWVHNNVPHSSTIIINNYLYTDLHAQGGQGVVDGAVYPYANDYLDVAYDPELHDVLLHNDWNRIDYIVADSEMLHDIKTLNGPMLLIDRALHHAILRKEFHTNNYNQQYVVQIYQVIHTNTSGNP